MPATIAVDGQRCVQPLQEEAGEGGKEEIADINMRGEYEEEIAEDAARRQPQEIEHGSGRSQLAEKVIEHCQQHDDEQPDAEQED